MVTGRAIPANARPVPRAEARAQLGLPAEGPVLLVAGARAGARSLNELAVEAFGQSGPAVLHISGERDFDSLRSRVSRPDYVLLPVLDGLGAAYGAADLALMRSGSTVWELAAAGLPAVLVPYPFATADHQTKNARYFEACRRRDRDPRERAGPGARDGPVAARRPASPRADERGHAQRRDGPTRPSRSRRS